MFLKKFKFEIDLLWVHPLSKIWTVVKSARLCHEDSVEVDFKKIQVFVEQVVLLLGQASNSIFYYRRLYMLQALTDSQQQSKQMLREDSELLQVNDKNLFENKFRENICHTSKPKKQTTEMLSNISQTKHKPFCHDLPQTPRRSFGGKQQQKHLLRLGTTSQYSKKRYNSGNQNSYGYGYGKYKAGNIVQQSGIFLCSSSGGSKTHFYTSLHKKLILCKKNFNCAISRKVKQLYRELENSDKPYINSVVITELCRSISQNSPTEKHPKLSQIKPGRKDSSTKGNSRDVEQDSKCRDLKPLGMGIYQQPFFS